jgi:hypothetical protein
LIIRAINIVFLILIFANTSFAQKDTLAPFFDKSDVEIKKIDDSRFDEYRNKEEFNYFRDNISPETIWDYIKYMFQKFINYIFGDNNPIGITLKYLFIIGFITALVLFLLKSRFRLLFYKNKNISDGILISEINEDINKLDIVDLIKNAKTDKNWRLAIRYYYLNLLKALSNKEIIIWEINKTNKDYINELKTNNYYEKFKELSYIYNYVWYGNFNIDESSFIEISLKFDLVLQNINNKDCKGE